MATALPETSTETRTQTRPLRERCGLLKDYWYVACQSGALKNRPLGRQIMDEALVLYRDRSGKPRCFRDRCLHRNTMLSEGTLENDCLRCPYHGWVYDEAGQVIKIPSARKESPLPKKTLQTFPTREVDGLVWVYMGEADEAEATANFRFPHYDEQGWETYYMETMFENDVTNCVENFMDVPHTVFVHAAWFRDQTGKEIRATVERTDDSVLVTYHQERDKIGFSTLILNPTGEPTSHTDKFYMPNVTRVDYDFGTKRSFIITSQCTPETERLTRVYTAITFRLGSRILGKLGRLVLPPYTRKVIHQDVVIMLNQGKSLARYGSEFINSEADLLHRYIESLRNWAEGGGEGPKPKPTSEEIAFFV
ncbi:MAG: aromatic ring-hydroxylating dioxygenase subunit alpha [Planctomycetes bacterium]|nr:aromatic ring-hydroxylating dioxygenase subunit alpha [Planctomycetota bacterium]